MAKSKQLWMPSEKILKTVIAEIKQRKIDREDLMLAMLKRKGKLINA